MLNISNTLPLSECKGGRRYGVESEGAHGFVLCFALSALLNPLYFIIDGWEIVLGSHFICHSRK